MSLLFQPLQQINFIPPGVVNFGNKSLSCSKRFLAFSSYMTLVVYDQTNFRLVRLFTSNSVIRTIQFSKKNDNFIAIATNDYAIIYDIILNAQVSRIYTPHSLYTMCWTPDDSIIVGFSHNYDTMFFFNSKIESYKQYNSFKYDINEQLYDPNHGYFNVSLSPNENSNEEEKIHKIQILFNDTYIATSISLKQKAIFILGCEASQIVRVSIEENKFDFFKPGKECGVIKGIDYDPFNPTNCLTVWSNGIIILLDLSTDQMIEIHRVTIDLNLTSSIFLSSPPGHFLVGNGNNGVIQLFSSTSNDPIEKTTVGNCGIRYMERASSSIKNLRDSVVINFIDGSIIVFDLFSRQKIWQNHSAHTNTVFDVKLLPTNPDILVSLGAEGSVCTWSIDDMTPIDRFVDKDDRFICMTITRGSGYIICGCQSGSIVVFSVKMLKILYKMKIFENGSRVRSIDGSYHQPGLILVTSEDGQLFLFDVEKKNVVWKPSNEMKNVQNTLLKDDEVSLEIENQKKSKKQKAIQSEELKFHGVAFSPHKDKTFASSCSSGILFINKDSSSYTLFSDDKYDLASVLWCPHDENILITTSDSGRVILWELLDGKKCKTKVITNHNGKSRGIAFHPTFKWLAASSGYDGCIHLFNISTYEVYCQVSAHNEPTYGLTFSPINPYLLVSSAADTTIRLWSIDKLFQSREDNLSNIFSKSIQELALRPLEGYEELIDLLIRLDKDNNNQSENETDNDEGLNKNSITFREGFIPHINDCIRIIRRRIRRMISASPRETSMIKKAIKSRERMINAAKLALMSGNQKKYCELLFAAGEYDKALAVAPSVSYEFWRNLMKERIKLFESTNDKVNYQILIGEQEEAIKEITTKTKDDQDYNNAMLIAASQIFSDITFRVAQVKSKSKVEDNEKYKYCDLLFEKNQRLFEYFIASKASMFYLEKGKIFRAASCLLAVGDLKSAINILERNGELMAATFIANKFNLMNRKLAIKLMKINPSFVWKFLPTELQTFTFPLLSIEDQLQNIDHEKPKNTDDTNVANKMLNLLIEMNKDTKESHSKLKNIILIGLSFLTEQLQKDSWDFMNVKEVLDVFELIDTDSFSQKNLIFLNSIDFYVATYNALWKGLKKIIQKLVDIGEFLATKIKDEHPWICEKYQILKNVIKQFKYENKCTIAPAGFDLIGSSFINLQDSNNHKEIISIQELLMWQEVTTFSPTGSCERIYFV